MRRRRRRSMLLCKEARMTEHTYANKQQSQARMWLQRKSPTRIGAEDDDNEREAESVTTRETSGRPAARSALSRIPVAQVQRDGGETQTPKSDEEKYMEAAQTLGEAFLATDVGKHLKEQAEQDPLVKGAKEAGESFICHLYTTP